MKKAIEQSNIDTLRALARGEMPGWSPVAELLGWKLLSLEPGYARVQFTARPEWYSPLGRVQGGFIAAMLDDTMGPAAFASLEPGQGAPTLDLTVNFYRSVSAGTVIVEGRVVHRTRRVLFLEGRLFREDGELAAVATANALIGQVTPTDGS